MLTVDRISKLPDASVRDRKVEVELADDSRRRNRFFLPPIRKLADTKRYKAENREITQQADDENIAKASREEFESLFRKYDRFKTSPIFLTRLANLSKACGDIEKALEFSRQAVELSKQPIYSFKYAEAAFNAGQRELGHKLLMQLESQQYSDAYLRLAENFINVGKIDIAEQYIGKALNQNLDDWKARMVAGTLELVKGQHERAVRHYRVALDGRPN